MQQTQHPISELPRHVQKWAALRIKARSEKFVAGALADVNIPVYLPLMTKITIYRGKRQTRILPVFSGYVFCSGEDFVENPAVPRVIRQRVAQILRPADSDQLRTELTELADFLIDRQLVQERVFGRPGDPIRVVGGPLFGTEGIIRRLKPDKRQIIIEISFIGSRVEVAVDEWLVSRI